MAKNSAPATRSHLGQTLLDFRHQARLSQQRLADISNVSRGTIRNIESGSTKPDGDTLIYLANGLTLDADGNIDPIRAKDILDKLNASDYLDRTGPYNPTIDVRQTLHQGRGVVPQVSSSPDRTSPGNTLDTFPFDRTIQDLRQIYLAESAPRRQALVQALESLGDLLSVPIVEPEPPVSDLPAYVPPSRSYGRHAPIPTEIRHWVTGRSWNAVKALCAEHGEDTNWMEEVYQGRGVLDDESIDILASALASPHPDELNPDLKRKAEIVARLREANRYQRGYGPSAAQDFIDTAKKIANAKEGREP